MSQGRTEEDIKTQTLPSTAYEPRDTGWPSGTVIGRWNPLRLGVYSDWIIKQMGATHAEIQAHIERVIGAEVARSKPFVFLPNSKAEGGGYFV